eukprot:3113271-Lingulodinium_polyedra.AAC.1
MSRWPEFLLLRQASSRRRGRWPLTGHSGCAVRGCRAPSDSGAARLARAGCDGFRCAGPEWPGG